jgi:hypothetical protein
MRKAFIFVGLAFMASLALVEVGSPAALLALTTRAGWILLLASAWWLAGRVISGK